MFLSCVFISFIFVFLTSGQDCNSGRQKRIHFRTDMEHHICRPVNNSDVSLGYQFCKNITFILYVIYNVRYNKDECPSSTSRKEVYSCTFNYFKNKSGTMEYHGHCENPFFPTYYWEREQQYYRIKRIADQLIDISIFLSQFNSDANALYPCNNCIMYIRSDVIE